ncbi:MAG: ABC transporter permease, partial [Treponemataceae bacterium]|nr:ABC transporter permease [Treponemataceae bacterium]
LRSTDLKLLTALVVAIALAVPVFKGKLFRCRHSLPARLEESTRHSNVIKKHAVPNTETLGENKNC